MSKQEEIVVGDTTYTKRKFQSGPGHDWLRPGPNGHRSASAEVNRLIDEIARLRADKEILDWLIQHEAIEFGHELGGDYDKVRVGACGCCSRVIDTPTEVAERIPHWDGDLEHVNDWRVKA